MGKYKRGHISGSRLSRSKVTPVTVFCVSSIIALLSLLICFVVTRGELITYYFWPDVRDTGMDFFHSMEYVRGRVPYERYDTLYPPLANLFFLCLYYIVPVGITNQWAPDFWSSIAYRGTNVDLRTYQAPMLLFILVLIITAWMIVSLIIAMLKRLPYRQANCAALCLLLSPGMLLSFERGNILFFVIPMCLFFIHYRNSSNWFVRELALISLAFAAGMKLYPAFFGILLLRDKKYAQALRAVLYGILSVILPALVFKEGLAGIPIWLSIVFDFGSVGDLPHIGSSFANILHRIALYSKDYLGIELNTDSFSVISMLLSALLLIVSMGFKKDWQSVLAITMAIIMFSSNGQYIYGFMCIPAVMFLMEEPSFTRNNLVPFALITLLCVNIPLFGGFNGHYPNVAVRQLISLLIVCWCIYYAVTLGIKKVNKITSRRKNNGNLEK